MPAGVRSVTLACQSARSRTRMTCLAGPVRPRAARQPVDTQMRRQRYPSCHAMNVQRPSRKTYHTRFHELFHQIY